MLWLGRAGLIPFILLPAAAWIPLLSTTWAAQAFCAYSLAILCFLAGTLWGTAQEVRGAHKNRRLLASNAFVLIAVGAVVFLPTAGAVALLLLTHLLQAAYEQATAASGWYLRFRWQLTLVASVCHLALLPLVA